VPGGIPEGDRRRSGRLIQPGIWFVSELYYPEETSTGYYVTKTAEGLAEHRPVGVLCSQPTYSARGVQASKTETRRGVSIRRCAGTALDKDVSVFRLFNLVTISISIFWNALRQFRRSDVVFVATNPPTLPYLVLLACRMRGARCVLMMQDVYPDALVAGGWLRPQSLLRRVLARFQRSLYSGVERVVVLGRDMQSLVARQIRQRAERIVIIPNWADLDQITPLPRRDNALLARLGLQDKFVIQYSGNMGRTHGLESLVEAAGRLKNDADVHFLFIGSGAKKRWLERAVALESLPNVTILPHQRRSDLAVALNACDAAIISFVPGMAGVSVPSRMYNVLAAGKPIIAVADADSELSRLVLEERVGWVVPPNDVEGIVRAVRAARDDPALLADMSSRCRPAVENKYSFERVIAAYRALVDELEESVA
jgi:glycosyltransferase involved in cell wall biosynthesis